MRVAVALALGLFCAACDKLSAFDLEVGESYCGNITLGGGYRQGFSPRVQMRLRFDADRVEAGESPGTLTTSEAGDDTVEDLLSEVELRPIAPLSNDPLSQLEFGDGRDKNLIYAVTPNNVRHESLLAVVSLRSDETVEVRLLRAGSPTAAEGDPYHQPLFGLFTLSRQPGECF
jgi:hypothetical protein